MRALSEASAYEQSPVPISQTHICTKPGAWAAGTIYSALFTARSTDCQLIEVCTVHHQEWFARTLQTLFASANDAGIYV